MQLKVIEDDPDMLYFKNNCESGYTEMELRVCDLWITNQLLDPTKTFIFHELFLPKYDNFKMISTEDICLSPSCSLALPLSLSLSISLSISLSLSLAISLSQSLSLSVAFKEWSWTMKEQNSVNYVVIQYN